MTTRSVGRIVGLLVLAHLASGLILPYVLLRPLSAPPGFLETAAGMALRVRLNVLLLFVGGAVPIAIATTAWPVFRQHGHALRVWLLALAAANLSLQAVENSHYMNLLSLSQAYAEAGAADAEIFQSLAIVVRSAWKWAHYSHLLVLVGWLFVFFGVLYRCALVPRALAATGMVMAVLQVSGIPLPVFLGQRVPLAAFFGIPLGVAYLGLALWLVAKGFKEPHGTLGAEAHGVAVPGA